MTTIDLTDTPIHVSSCFTDHFTLPISLDSLAKIVNLDDPARVILFARHYPNIPSNIRGVLK